MSVSVFRSGGGFAWGRFSVRQIRMVDLVRGVWWEACVDMVFAAAAIVGCKKAVIVPSCCKNAVIVGCKKAVIVGCKKAAAPILAIHQGSGHCG